MPQLSSGSQTDSDSHETAQFLHRFSHIYVEKQARDYPLTSEVLAKFEHAQVVEIEHYKDVFARSKQSFAVQKNSQKLILAVQQAPYLYRGSEVSHDFGNAHFYYTSSVLNCLYNCDYCFLQGMFPSANIVLFVNIEDNFAELDRLLQHHPVYLSITYETDILAFESIAPMTKKWVEFASSPARQAAGLTMEVRTKSANIRALDSIRETRSDTTGPSPENVMLAWTISPDEVIRKHESKTPGLEARLRAIAHAAANGWNVRLCFDPILPIADWQRHYRACIERTFAVVPVEAIRDISIGTFRISKEYLKTMRRDRLDSELLHQPFECRDGVFSYGDKMTAELLGFVRGELERYISGPAIFSL